MVWMRNQFWMRNGFELLDAGIRFRQLPHQRQKMFAMAIGQLFAQFLDAVIIGVVGVHAEFGGGGVFAAQQLFQMVQFDLGKDVHAVCLLCEIQPMSLEVCTKGVELCKKTPKPKRLRWTLPDYALKYMVRPLKRRVSALSLLPR